MGQCASIDRGDLLNDVSAGQPSYRTRMPKGSTSLALFTQTELNLAAKPCCVVIGEGAGPNAVLSLAGSSPAILELPDSPSIQEHTRFMNQLIALNEHLRCKVLQTVASAGQSAVSAIPLVVTAHAQHVSVGEGLCLPHILALTPCHWSSSSAAANPVPACLITHVPSSPILAEGQPVMGTCGTRSHTSFDGRGQATGITPRCSLDTPVRSQETPIVPYSLAALSSSSSTTAWDASLSGRSLTPSVDPLPLLIAASDASPLLMTVCGEKGSQVWYQNAGSLSYAGNRTANLEGWNYLRQLLILQPPELLDELLECVILENKPWTRVLQVPPFLAEAVQGGRRSNLGTVHGPNDCAVAPVGGTLTARAPTRASSGKGKKTLRIELEDADPPSAHSSASLNGIEITMESHVVGRFSNAVERSPTTPGQEAANRSTSLDLSASKSKRGALQCVSSSWLMQQTAEDGTTTCVEPEEDMQYFSFLVDEPPADCVVTETRGCKSHHNWSTQSLIFGESHVDEDPLLTALTSEFKNPRSLRACRSDKDTSQSAGSPKTMIPTRQRLLALLGATTSLSGANVFTSGANVDSSKGLANEESDTTGVDDHTEQPCAWHEVTVIPFLEPRTGQKVLLVAQSDVTTRSLMEQRLMQMTEAQLYLLENMFPRHILERIASVATADSKLAIEPDNMVALTKELSQAATHHDCVTIMFTDIVGFTAMSKEVGPEKVMAFLNELFSKFDELVAKHKVSKVETAGDCYIVCGGLLEEDKEGFHTLATDNSCARISYRRAARRVLNFAAETMQVARTVLMPHNGQPVQQRVGIHSGPVVSGLIGQLLPKFALFGDTMVGAGRGAPVWHCRRENTASRMESTSIPGRIQVSQATHSLLQDASGCWECTGGVAIKGKGTMITYLLSEEAMRGQHRQPQRGIHSPRSFLLETSDTHGTESSPSPNRSSLSSYLALIVDPATLDRANNRHAPVRHFSLNWGRMPVERMGSRFAQIDGIGRPLMPTPCDEAPRSADASDSLPLQKTCDPMYKKIQRSGSTFDMTPSQLQGGNARNVRMPPAKGVKFVGFGPSSQGSGSEPNSRNAAEGESNNSGNLAEQHKASDTSISRSVGQPGTNGDASTRPSTWAATQLLSISAAAQAGHVTEYKGLPERMLKPRTGYM